MCSSGRRGRHRAPRHERLHRRRAGHLDRLPLGECSMTFRITSPSAAGAAPDSPHTLLSPVAVTSLARPRASTSVRRSSAASAINASNRTVSRFAMVGSPWARSSRQAPQQGLDRRCTSSSHARSPRAGPHGGDQLGGEAQARKRRAQFSERCPEASVRQRSAGSVSVRHAVERQAQPARSRPYRSS